MSTDYKILDDEELIALIKIDLGKELLDTALIKSKFLSKKPVTTEGVALTAKIYAQLGLFDKAKACYQAYLKIDGDAITERFQLGMVLFDKGESEEAFKEWESILEKEPAHPPTLFYKGLSLANQKKTTEAQKCLTILLQSAPSDNLYFGRAKELLDNISKQAELSGPKNAIAGAPNDAYRTIN